MSDWIKHRIYDLTFANGFILFTLTHSLRIVGRTNVPKTGPVLLVSNHQSYLDPCFLGLACRRYIKSAARKSLFRNRYFGAYIQMMGAVPFEHKGYSREGLQTLLKELERGRAVVLYAEGERTYDGRLEPIKPGVSLLIKKVKAPIVPVAIAGAYDAWPRHAKYPRLGPLFAPPSPRTVAVSIGKPISPDKLAGLDREPLLRVLDDAVAVEFARANQLKRQKRSIRAMR